MHIATQIRLNNEREIINGIVDAFVLYFQKVIRKVLPAVVSRIGNEIEPAIKQSPEYQSFAGAGILYHELGVLEWERAIEDIIKTIRAGIFHEEQPVKRVGDSLTGGFTIGILKSDYSDVLGLSSTSFVSENSHQVEWLRWLLLAGGTLVVENYKYDVSPRNLKYSRTNEGVMIKSSQSWGVPAQFQGTSSDNWLTRALGTIPVEDIVINEFGKGL